MIQYQCPKCGRAFAIDQVQPNVKCPYCGQEFAATYQQGYQQGFFNAQQQQQFRGVFDAGPSGKSRGVAAILAILLGALGIHFFYLGKTSAGIIFLLISVLSCGILGAITQVIAVIQGIIMLTQTEEQFEQRYIYCTDTVPLF